MVMSQFNDGQQLTRQIVRFLHNFGLELDAFTKVCFSLLEIPRHQQGKTHIAVEVG